MKYYEQKLELGCFSKSKVIELTGTEAAAKFILYDYQKKGYIEKVKRDLYAVISLETKQPVLSRYQRNDCMDVVVNGKLRITGIE